MMEHDKKVKKLNILMKLLKKPFVQVKKTLGDEELVNEINEEIKEFVMAQVEVILNAQVPISYPDGSGASLFTNDEVTVLKGLAAKILSKASLPDSKLPTVDIEATPPVSAPPSPIKKAHGPVWQALRGAGYDPDTFKDMNVEDRRKIMKQIEQGKGK